MQKKKIKFSFSYVVIAILILIGGVVAGLPDYITAHYDPHVFLTASYWINIVTTNVGTLSIILAILLFRVDKFKVVDESYNDIQSKINTFYNQEYQTTIFNKFCAEHNRKEKKDVYRSKIHKKYSKLKPKVKDLEIYNGKDEEAKKNNKHCQKEKYFSSLLDETYIENTIDKMHIKYNGISDSLIFSGVTVNKDNKDYITKHKAFKVAKDLAPKYLISFGLSLLVSSVIPDFKDGITAAIIIKTAIKIFTMASQIFFAVDYSNLYNNTVILHDIKFRYGIITDYKMWYQSKINKPKEMEVK